jgi:hypothetical protein
MPAPKQRKQRARGGTAHSTEQHSVAIPSLHSQPSVLSLRETVGLSGGLDSSRCCAAVLLSVARQHNSR